MVMAMVAVDPKDSIVRREVQSVDFGYGVEREWIHRVNEWRILTSLLVP